MRPYDAIVIGGGHNGLVHAAYLARAGRRVLVVERRHVVGGAAVTEEVFPGFHISVCSYVVSLLRPQIIRELDLARHGFEVLPLDGTFTPMPNGNYLWRVNDHGRTRREILRHSRLDAEAYDEYGKAMIDMARFAKPTLDVRAPDPLSLSLGDLREMLRLGRRFQSMSSESRYRLVQLMTMSAADFLDQWFETDVLKATMSASGIIGTFQGVRSPGTAYVLLHHYMGEIDGAFRSWGFAKGGTGAISNAIAAAAREAGVEIRTSTRRFENSRQERTRNRRRSRQRRRDRGHDRFVVCGSSADVHEIPRRRRAAGGVPGSSAPIQVSRLIGKGESGARWPPQLHRRPGREPPPAGGDLDISQHRVHGACVRRCEVRTVFGETVHGRRDSQPHRSVDLASRQARDDVLRAIRAVPSEGHDVGRRTGSIRRCGDRHAVGVRAESQVFDPAPPGGDAARSRTRVGTERGQHLSRRARPRAAAVSSAGSRLGKIPDADREPLHVRIGDPSRAAASWARPAGMRQWKFSSDRRHFRRRRSQRSRCGNRYWRAVA